MNRPRSRPESLLGPSTILAMARQHFVKDKAPRCVGPKHRSCAYSGTGCWVGFMLTAEDAAFLDNSGNGIYTLRNLWTELTHRVPYSKRSEVLCEYFDLRDPLVFTVLLLGQSFHDMSRKSPTPDEREKFISSLDTALNFRVL